MRDEYEWRLSRIKGRGSVPLSLVKKFETPEVFTVFNKIVIATEKKYRVRINNNEYKLLINEFYNEPLFKMKVERYLAGGWTLPSFTKRDKTLPLKGDNIRLTDQFEKIDFTEYKTVITEMASINRNMKNPVGVDFLIQFEDPEKIRFLLKAISVGYDLSVEEKKAYIDYFYDNNHFCYLYETFIKTGDKYIKPVVNLKIPRSKGGGNNIGNLQFISYLEHNAKCDLTETEWQDIRKDIKKYFVRQKG